MRYGIKDYSKDGEAYAITITDNMTKYIAIIGSGCNRGGYRVVSVEENAKTEDGNFDILTVLCYKPVKN